MKVIVLQNMSGPEVAYRKGKEYDLEDALAESFIGSGHAIAAKGVEVPQVETAVEKKEVEKAVKTSYKKK